MAFGLTAFHFWPFLGHLYPKQDIYTPPSTILKATVTIFAWDQYNHHLANIMLATLLKTSLGRLRIIAFTEGLSFLILLGIAMPLKYILGIPQAVRVVGMAHGVLFILYVVLLIQVAIEKSWSFKLSFLAFLASLVPFGTFYADAKWFRSE